MKISIITVCWNAEDTISRCMSSVAQQNYSDYEHIVIDGSSTDSTVEIISRFRCDKTIVISEPDKGIYDAMNKGLAMVSGELVHFLNSDDSYADCNVLEDVVNKVSLGSSVVLGDVNYGTSKAPNIWHASAPTPRNIKFGWHPAHPGFFCKSEIYKRVGNFDQTYRISADFDLMMRIVLRNLSGVVCLGRVTTNMDPYGASSSFAAIIEGNRNVAMSAKLNHISSVPWLYLVLRVVPKIKRKFISSWSL